jgi:hypothetical protein
VAAFNKQLAAGSCLHRLGAAPEIFVRCFMNQSPIEGEGLAPVASQESAGVSGGVSRRSLLALGGAVAASTLVAGGLRADVLDSLKRFLDLDPIVLNYAHELEELQYEYFSRLARSQAYQQMEARERSVITAIAAQDKAHLEALDGIRGRLGARPGGHFESMNASASRRPRIFKFPSSAFATRKDALTTAVEIKENAVSAYHGAVDLLREKKALLEPAAAIAGVEGRHLAILREMAGLDPIPSSFELQISPQTVGSRLSKFGFKGGAMRQGQF